MTKRERLLVVAMTGSLLWGATTVVYGFMKSHGGAARLERERAELEEFARSQRAVMGTMQLNEHERRVLDEANATWVATPFAPVAATGPSEERMREFFYTGHLKVGSSQLAIINGREYRVSDPIAASDFVVEEIAPAYVVLAATSGSRRITLDMQASPQKRKSP